MKRLKEPYLSELKNFFDGYFHPFWKDINSKRRLPNPGDFHHQLMDLLNRETMDAVIDRIQAIDHLLSLELSEQELESLLRTDFEVSFNAYSRGMTYNQWLTEVRKTLFEGLNPTK